MSEMVGCVVIGARAGTRWPWGAGAGSRGRHWHAIQFAQLRGDTHEHLL